MRDTNNQRGRRTRGDAVPPRRRLANVLVIEPGALLRWSLVTYLGKSYHVFPADTSAAGEAVLDRHPVDAVVLCDDLGEAAVDRIESLARERNPHVRVIRVVTSVRSVQSGSQSMCIEKPFELSKLAAMLDPSTDRPPSSTAPRPRASTCE